MNPQDPTQVLIDYMESQKKDEWHLSKSVPIATFILILGLSFGGYAKFVGMQEAIADIKKKEKLIVSVDKIELMFDKRDIQIENLSSSMLDIKAVQLRQDNKLDRILETLNNGSR